MTCCTTFVSGTTRRNGVQRRHPDRRNIHPYVPADEASAATFTGHVGPDRCHLEPVRVLADSSGHSISNVPKGPYSCGLFRERKRSEINVVVTAASTSRRPKVGSGSGHLAQAPSASVHRRDESLSCCAKRIPGDVNSPPNRRGCCARAGGCADRGSLSPPRPVTPPSTTARNWNNGRSRQPLDPAEQEPRGATHRSARESGKSRGSNRWSFVVVCLKTAG